MILIGRQYFHNRMLLASISFKVKKYSNMLPISNDIDKLLKSFMDEMVAPQTNKIKDDNLLEILSGAVSASSQFLKILSGLYKGVVGFSNYFFARKACKFLSDISDLDVQKRYKFVGEIAVRGKDNAGYIFMSLLQ